MAQRFLSTPLLLSLLLVAAGTIGCHNPGDDAPKETHPAWLVGGYSMSGYDLGGDATGAVVKFEASGLGTEKFATFSNASSLALESSEVFEWAMRGDKLVLDGFDGALQVSPGCSYVEVHGNVYERDDAKPVADCPYPIEPLSADETKFAGSWSGSGDEAWTLTLTENRRLALTHADHVTPTRMSYWIDVNGGLHGVQPDGKETFTAVLYFHDEYVKLCVESRCRDLYRQ